MRTFMTVSALTALAAAAPCVAAQSAAGSIGPPLAISIRGMTLHQDMRRLWSTTSSGLACTSSAP